ncbi:MAG TPA: exodeoxyribonuclease VII small subunit, partial [Schlesneria sp.]
MPKRKSASEHPESTASFEESLGELQMIVSELEDGEIGLETSLARFERGIRLLRTCYSILEAA